MTFEEFFHKKKIDLVQLQQAESVLFYEFKSHFAEMGEKSFDHSKKFWFNKLRRLYHIVEEPKAERTKIEINQIASQAEPLSSPVPESKTGFTPRFKAKPIVSEENDTSEEKPEINESEIQSSVKPAFKPRFKPQLTKPEVKEGPKGEDSGLDENPAEAQEKTAAKPAFKPRFKPQLAKPLLEVEPIKLNEEKKEENLEVSKPIGFKPRFKAQITKPTTDVPQESEVKPVEIKEESKAEEETPKLGFKPRFKAGVTTPKMEGSDNTEVAKSEEKTAEESAPKLGFKPRFKAGVTAPKFEVTENKNAPGSLESTTEEEPTPKLGFKPRFKAGVTKAPIDETKFIETEKSSTAIEPIETFPNRDLGVQLEDNIEIEKKIDTDSPSPDSSEISDGEKPAIIPPAKLGFKPRFKAQVTKQNPPAENPE
ncbi:MAG: hypothetical protein JWQ25_2508 [Daejeonella sp.]|nr:hypothetical protein [Daejeonella sp.]